MTMIKVSLEEIGKEERLAIEKNMLTEGVFSAVNALVDVLGGEGALKVLRPYAQMSSRAITINLIDIFGIEGSDFEKIADVTLLFDMLMGGYTEYDFDLERNQERVIRAYVDCPFKSAPRESCIWGHEMILEGICESINPNFGCRFTQMMPKGDPMCSYVIERRR